MSWKDEGELFVRYKKNPLLTVEDWPYQAHSVFNPAVTMVNGTTILLVRVEDHRGFSHLTVARSKKGINCWDIDVEPTHHHITAHHSRSHWLRLITIRAIT